MSEHTDGIELHACRTVLHTDCVNLWHSGSLIATVHIFQVEEWRGRFLHLRSVEPAAPIALIAELVNSSDPPRSLEREARTQLHR